MMSTANGASPARPRYSRRHRNPVSEEEVSDWFDSDGRLVKDSVMREALFHVGVASPCRPCLWKFLLGLYPVNSTRRDQKTIDLENRANYYALRQRWRILDKTIEVPDIEPNAHDNPFYMELSDDDTDDSIYTTEPKKSIRKKTAHTVEAEKEEMRTDSNEQLVDSHTNGVGSSQSESGGVVGVGGVSDESGAPDTTVVSTLSCECEQFDQTPVSESGTGCETSNRTLCPDESDRRTKGETTAQTLNTQNETVEETSNQTSTSHRSDGVACENSEDDGDGECKCKFRSSCENLSSDEEALLKILDFPSRVYAARQPVQLETSYPKAKRIILRDVSRTDRNYHYFTHKRNLRKVHRILMVYAMFHPEVGYAQGMNDILARFLVVTDSEVDSYWLFVQYMEGKKGDFLEHSMMRKVALVKKLVKEIDKELYMFFGKSDCHDYLFCHRWLLLDFKREFPFEDSLRIFEVLCSQYLELNSDKAIRETDKVIAKEFELDAGETRSERSEVNLDFTFDLFMCVAILTMNSADICKASDAAGIYGCLNGLAMKMSLSEVLIQAEELFYKYCRQNITRGFAEIEL